MKKYLLSFAMLLTIFGCMSIVSCSKDDDKNEPSKDPGKAIVGTWMYTYANDGDEKNFMFNFEANGNFEFKDWYSVSEMPTEWEETGEWIISGDKLTLNWGDGDSYTYSFSINGNYLTINGYPGPGANVFIATPSDKDPL